MNVWERVHAMVISVLLFTGPCVVAIIFYAPFFGKTQEVPLENAVGEGEGWRCRVFGGV